MKYLTRIICCAASLLFAAGICQAANQTGALLEINGTVSASNRSQPVDLIVTDSVIHSGPFPCSVAGSNCRVVPLHTEASEPNCTASDEIATNAYVLQGGSPTGCDPGNDFETTQGTGTYRFKATSTNSTPGYQFDVSTIYCTTNPSAPTGQLRCVTNDAGQACNTNGTHCISGDSSSEDTGFMTVTNNGPTFTGTITLSGNSNCSDGLGQDTVSFSSEGGFMTGQSVVLALADDSSSCGGFQSDTTSGDIQPVAPGRTTTLLPDGPLTQSITIPPGTNMKCPNTPAVTGMRDVLKLVDPVFFDPTVENGNPGNVPLFGGTPIPGPWMGANPRCIHVTSSKCAIIINQCFDSNGNQFPDCKCIAPPQNSLIGLDSLYSNDVDAADPAYVIAQDDAAHQQLLPPPLGPDWTNITKSFLPGCTTPPCGIGGGGKRLNGQESIIDLNLTCQILTFAINPTTVSPGGVINVSGNIKGCPAFSPSRTGLLTFTFEGPIGQGCQVSRISIPPPPPPGGQQGGFPVLLPPVGSNSPFSFNLTVPSSVCSGAFKFSTTIKEGTVFNNASATLTVP
jgi:hypothetical protein